jgi:hypothetical protein
VDGDNVGGVDGRGSNTASRDGDLTIASSAIASSAIASTIAASVGDTLSELGALLSVGGLDIAEESASASIGVECGTGVLISGGFHKM